ncbi:PREDICTED: ribosomal RNA-processing protein 8 [Ceratosolen solmsi marchali]|uniref:Ribosomal RNA-processing protein 8 n=1 Tax=Ceratosolen solmsi marchali TaxID=326594 RepID=A0AAJ6YB78_9HYME|nr:PREDICTED: ribosomal RNA-processing protein 8 [Ceratosolen solmsi marchali]
MSKKKKVKGETKRHVTQKSKRPNVKGIKKQERKKIKHFGLQKIKNKQNIKDNVSRFKPKLGIQNNVKIGSTNNKTVNVPRKCKSNEKIVNKNSATVRNVNVVKKLNINKINAMLNANDNQMGFKDKRKLQVLSLRERMLSHLRSSRFRYLNEQMYNNTSSESKVYFQGDPQAFYAYHEGYKQQVARWPINPLNVIIESISKMYALVSYLHHKLLIKLLTYHKYHNINFFFLLRPDNYVIADFGCGDAKLANSVSHTVHSFDLIAMNDKVKACDMAHTPLLTGHINVVVFCLSLMGSNLKDYLLEANRVLGMNGILKIAEIESRFNKIDNFIKLMSNYGFVNTWQDLSNNLFYFLDFKKTKDILRKDVNKLPELTLKSCLYKKR